MLIVPAETNRRAIDRILRRRVAPIFHLPAEELTFLAVGRPHQGSPIDHEPLR
jgi:hypothetical protein